MGVTPRIGFADETTGAAVDRQSVEFMFLADRELIADRVIGAMNVLYEPGRTRLRGSGETERGSTLGAGAALAAQLSPGVFLGAETRYLRRYEGLALNSFGGHALYFGPTLYAKLKGEWWASLAWNAQVWGTAEARTGALDLAHFEQHQVKLRVGVSFGP